MGGSSNTPHTKPNINTCGDYLKIRFNVGHEKNPSFFEKMFKELGFNPDEFGREGVYNNYLHHLQMGVGATLAFGGTMTPTAKGGGNHASGTRWVVQIWHNGKCSRAYSDPETGKEIPPKTRARQIELLIIQETDKETWKPGREKGIQSPSPGDLLSSYLQKK